MSWVSHQRTQSADLYREKEFVLKQLGFHLCIGTNLVRWCPVNANGSQVHFSVWEVTDSLHRSLSLTFFFVAEFERKNVLFLFFTVEFWWAKNVPFTLTLDKPRKPKLHVLNSLCFKFSSRCFSKAFLSTKNHLIEENFFFLENKVFRFLQFTSETRQDKLREKSYLHQRIWIFQRFFLKKTALNSSIKVWFHDVLLLNDS